MYSLITLNNNLLPIVLHDYEILIFHLKVIITLCEVHFLSIYIYFSLRIIFKSKVYTFKHIK